MIKARTPNVSVLKLERTTQPKSSRAALQCDIPILEPTKCFCEGQVRGLKLRQISRLEQHFLISVRFFDRGPAGIGCVIRGLQPILEQPSFRSENSSKSIHLVSAGKVERVPQSALDN